MSTGHSRNMSIRTRGTDYPVIIAIMVLMVGILAVDVLIPLGVATGIPYIIAVLMALRLRKARWVLLVAGVCTVLTVLGYFLSPPGGILWMALTNRAVTILAIWVTAILSFQRKQFEQMLGDLPRQLIRFQDLETERIAKEIHEDIAQSIAVLKFTMASIFAESKAREGVLAGRRAEIGKHLETVLDDARQLSYGIHPSSLHILGLSSAIQDLVDNYRKKTKWNVDLALTPGDRLEGREAGINLYRILQAALDNAAQHAEAGSVWIKVREEGDVLRMTVSDDGRGFVLRERAWGGLSTQGLGLAVMAERAKSLGGELLVSSTPGRGTTVDVIIPLRQAKAEG